MRNTGILTKEAIKMVKQVSGLPNINEIDQMSSTEIREHVAEYRAALMTLNGQVKGQKKSIENPAQIKHIKRTIARMITVLVRRGERVVDVRS